MTTCEAWTIGVLGCVINCDVGYPVVVGDGREHDGGNGCEGCLASSEDGIAKLIEAMVGFAATQGTNARKNARKKIQRQHSENAVKTNYTKQTYFKCSPATLFEGTGAAAT